MKRTGYTFIKILSGICLLWLVSCSEKEPLLERTESYTFTKSGDMQMCMAGEVPENPITVSNSFDIRVKVLFEATSGGGSVDKAEQILPPFGTISTNWKTGKKSTKQTLVASIYKPGGKYLTKLTFSAYALQAGKWDTITYPIYSPDMFFEMARDMVHGKTYIVKNSKLYEQGNRYYQWNIVESFKDKYCRSIQADKQGTLYVVTATGELFRSVNQGETFIQCTKPFTNQANSYKLVITGNDILWVTSYSETQSWKFSVDGGQTWKSTNLPGNSGSWGIYGLPGNGYLTMTWDGNKHVLYHSANGADWALADAKLPKQYVLDIFVSDDGGIIAYTQSGPGIEIYKSTDSGKTFTRKYALSVDQVSSAYYTEKVGDTYYMYLPGSGFFKSKDFEQFDIVWQNPTLYKVLIDHQKVFFAIGTTTISAGYQNMYYGKDIE